MRKKTGMPELGLYLKSLREGRGFNLKFMAQRLDISQSYLSMIENGNRKISYPLFCKVVDVLNISEFQRGKCIGLIKEDLFDCWCSQIGD